MAFSCCGFLAKDRQIRTMIATGVRVNDFGEEVIFEEPSAYI